MSTDRLREAARVLRERAEAATPAPWSAHGVMVQSPVGDVAYDMDDCDSAYIATMHPGVGLALADWLDDLADHNASDLMPMERGAFAVADLILGGAR